MNIILLLTLSSLTAFLLAFFLIPVVIDTARRKGLFDLPDGRKQHTSPTPPLGGVAIFMGMAGSMIFWADAESLMMIRYSFLAMMVLFFVGLKDDLHEIKALKKLFIQLVMAFIVAFGGMRISNLYGFVGVYELPLPLQYVLTILFIVGLTNAYNLIDGIDGLAGGIAMIAAVSMAGIFYTIGDFGFAMYALALAGALMGFLWYNYAPAKIFMGDTGSLSVGLFLTILAIRLLDQGSLIAEMSFSPDWIPVWIFAMFSVPMLDISQVMIKRILDKRSPFSPDRGHVHHMLQRIGFSHGKASSTLYGISLFHLTIVWLGIKLHLPSSLGFVIVLAVGLLTLGVLYRLEKQKIVFPPTSQLRRVLSIIQSYLF